MTDLADTPRIVRPIRATVAAIALLSAALVASATAAAAGDAAAKAAEAETLLGTGNATAAFEAMDAAVDVFWGAAPLTIADAYLVAKGNGTKPEPDSMATFGAGESVEVALRPLGYGFDTDGETYRIALATGIEIRTPGGLVLAKSEDFGRLEWSGPGKDRAFAGRINIDMPDLKPGQYQLLLTLSDDVSQKSASVTLPFEIAAE